MNSILCARGEKARLWYAGGLRGGRNLDCLNGELFEEVDSFKYLVLTVSKKKNKIIQKQMHMLFIKQLQLE